MTTLRPDFDRQDDILQPQLSRQHFAYRSPMKSQALNEEIQQFRYDIAKLYVQTNSLTELITSVLTTLCTDTDDMTGLQSVEYVNAATPYYSTVNFAFKSLETLAKQLAKLDQRLTVLERGL